MLQSQSVAIVRDQNQSLNGVNHEDLFLIHTTFPLWGRESYTHNHSETQNDGDSSVL